MRILLVNKFYFPQGGADKHVIELERLLTAAGHEVAIFAMTHPKNIPTPWAKYFVSFIDFSRVRFNWQGMRVVGRTLHSFEAARQMKKMLRDFKPDVVHLHNIYHQISPSILPIIARAGIPMVQTLHDYSLISANYTLAGHGGICEHGKGGRYWEYILHRCIRHSLAASLLGAIDQWWHDRTRVYERYVAAFISPSQFLKTVVTSWKPNIRRVDVIPNFTSEIPRRVWPKDGSIIYVGRLSGEKGVATLIRAAKDIPAPVHIIGTGPDESRLRALAAEVGASNIVWHGFLTGAPLAEYLSKASAMVVPSTWYENNPLVILESFAYGTPVVGARIGGIPELVRDGETGRLFTPGDVGGFVQAVQAVRRDVQDSDRLSTACMQVAQAYTPQEYLEKLMKLYASVLA